MFIGLDFGTCYSSAALSINNSSKPIKEPISRGYSFPSSVFITAQEQILIGQAAENSRQKDPQRYRREFKRDLGSPNPYTVGSSAWLPEELITEVIIKLKTEAERVAQGFGEAKINDAVLTVPATYQPFKRQLMKQAGIKAGFSQIKLLEEPVAAAYYYSRQAEIKEGEIVLVYDLGGGTFDATLIQKQNSGYQILGIPKGLSHCGGTDFDRQIYQGLKNRCSDQLREQLESRDAWLARAIVTESCRDLKHQLSEQLEATIYIPMGLTSVESYSLSRSEFNQMIASLIAETIECCDQLVRNAGIQWQQVDRVLLVGGSCRIPYIKTAVEQKLKRLALLIDEPELAVCIGAAIDGLKTNKTKTQVLVNSPVEQPLPATSPVETLQPATAPAETISPQFQAKNLYQQALDRSKALDYSAAIASLSQALELNPDYPEALDTRAAIRKAIGDKQGAIDDWQKAAQMFFERQDFTQYRQTFEKIQSTHLASVQTEVTARKKKSNDELPSQQNTSFATAEVQLPSNKQQPIETHLSRALTAFYAQNYQQAIEASTKEIELNSECADAYICRAVARTIEQDYRGATQDFDRAVQKAPEHGGAYLGRSILRAFSGDHRRAFADCQKLAQIDSNFNRAEHNKNMAAAAQKNIAETINYLHKATCQFCIDLDNVTPMKTQVKSEQKVDNSFKNYLSQIKQSFLAQKYTWDETVDYGEVPFLAVAKGNSIIQGFSTASCFVFADFTDLDLNALRCFARESCHYGKSTRTGFYIRGMICYSVALVGQEHPLITTIADEPLTYDDSLHRPNWIFPIVFDVSSQAVHCSARKTPFTEKFTWLAIAKNARQMLE